MVRNMEALLRLMEARQAVAFAWARPFDCVSFADEAVFAQCGWRPFKGLTWTTHRGALRVIRRCGGIEAGTDARMAGIAPAQAMRGDIAGVHDPVLGVALMVVEGDTLVGPGERGLKRRQRAAMIRAWSAVRPDV